MKNVAIIGFPKCATTSLIHFLQTYFHKDYHILPGEPNHEEVLSALNLDDRSPPLLFKNPSIIYELSKWTPILQQCKIIICFQHPIDFIQSYYQYRRMEIEQRFLISDEETPLLSLETILSDSTLCWHGICSQHMNLLSYVYDVYSLFDYSLILLLSMKELTRHSNIYYSRVCRFLCLSYDSHYTASHENKNESKQWISPDTLHFLQLRKPMYDDMYQTLLRLEYKCLTFFFTLDSNSN